jgi:hypothetical protein
MTRLKETQISPAFMMLKKAATVHTGFVKQIKTLISVLKSIC